MDWKLRHKKECPSLCEIVRIHCDDKCDRIEGFLNSYHRNEEFSDRWLETAAELTSALD
jgi:hypothetical protein